MNLTDKDILKRLGAGESIATVCEAAGISRAEFEAGEHQQRGEDDADEDDQHGVTVSRTAAGSTRRVAGPVPVRAGSRAAAPASPRRGTRRRRARRRAHLQRTGNARADRSGRAHARAQRRPDPGRDEPLDDLNRLRMGVRIDQEGRLEMDYHTARNILKAGGGVKETDISRRYYLADARFLVGLEGEVHLLKQIEAALKRPVWQLYLGRKAFVPSEPIWLRDGLMENASLEEGLRIYPYLGLKPPAARLRAVIEDEQGWLTRPDAPLSFTERRFATRRVKVVFLDSPARRLDDGEVN